MNGFLRRLWRWAVTLLGAVVILLALLVGLFRILVPELPDYKPQIEQWASDALGMPLRFGAIDARLGLTGPQLLLKDTEVLTPEDQQALTARSITLVFSPLKLVTERRPVLSRLFVDGVGLVVERTRDGEFVVLGQIAGAGSGRPAEVPLDMLPEGRLSVRDARIELRDRVTGAAPLEFAEVELDVEVEDERLQVLSTFDLPQRMGRSGRYTLERVTAEGDEASMRTTLQLTAIDLAAWSGFIPPELKAPRQGRGDVTAFAAFRGPRWESWSVDFDLSDVAAPTLADDTPPTVYEELSGSFEWGRKPTGWEFRGDDILVRRDGQVWPSTAVKIEQLAREDGAVTYLDASFLRLQDLMPLIAASARFYGAVPAELRNARGDVYGLKYQHVAGSQPGFTVNARVEEMALPPGGRFPGFEGLSAEVAAQNAGGRILLQNLATLQMPEMFRNELGFDTAGLNLSWTQSPQGIEVTGDSLRLANSELDIEGRFNLSLPHTETSPYLDLRLSVLRLDAGAKSRYLPYNVLKPNLLAWLDMAIVEGLVEEGEVRFVGPVREFPFREQQGEFRVGFLIKDCLFRYAANWPPVEAMTAEVVFVNEGLSATVLDGGLSGNKIESGSVAIPDLKQGRLDLDARTAGSAQALLGYVNASPIRDRFMFLAEFSGVGPVKAHVDLLLPLKDLAAHELALELDFEGVRIATPDFPQGFEDVTGRLTLRDGELRAQGVNARVFGKPGRIDIGSDPRTDLPRDTLMVVSGWSDAETLMQEIPLLRGRLEGATDWYAALRIPHAGSERTPELAVRSVLGGLTVDLPYPFGKEATEVRNLDLLLRFLAPGRRQLGLAIEDDIRAELMFEGAGFALSRGALVLGGEAAELPDEAGLEIRGGLPRGDLGRWLSMAGEGPGEGPRLEELLRRIELEIQDFHAFGLILGATEVTMERGEGAWQASIASEDVAGDIRVPFELATGPPVRLDMQRLRLVEWEEASEQEEPADPGKLPALSVAAQDFVLGERRLGSIAAEITKGPEGLTANTIRTGSETLVIEGSGSWLKREDGVVSTFTGTARSTDLGRSLDSLGFAGYIEGGNGNAQFDLDWRGPPDSRFLNTLGGRMSIEMRDGTLQEVEPGAGRAVGLLSITALRRRLSLDFSDVFGKGLAFDVISGDFTLVDGNAYTSNLIMDGPAVGVGITGRTGLAVEDYDQTAIVHANVGASLPVVGWVAGGPPLGIGLWIFSEVFKEPLKDIARARYRISGTWAEPVVVREAFSPAAEDATGLPEAAQPQTAREDEAE